VESWENASSQNFAYVDDEVVCRRDNDDGGESSGEVVGVVGNRFVLGLQGVSVQPTKSR
jgi:hypothetical protein